MKHVDIDRHIIKEKMDNGKLEVIYIPTSDQKTDLFTKSFRRQHFETLSSKLSLIKIYRPT